MKHIMDWMITEKIAKNDFNASAIVNGLELYKLDNDEAMKARVRLYRDWRNAGEPSKVAFQHAIKGDVIQALPIEGALLSEPEQEEEVCPECDGAGWIEIWGHACGGDERKCQYMCPVQEQAPCGTCGGH